MLVPNQLVEVHWNPYTQKYYQSKGYKFTGRGEPFMVKIEDLMKGSHAKVQVICDYCGKTYTKVYKDYFAQHENGDCCVNCEGQKSLVVCEKIHGKGYRGEKIRQIVKERYDVDCITFLPEITQKIKETNLAKYGYSTALLLPENREKCLLALKEESTIEKRKQTNLAKYGYEFPLSNAKIREKIAASYYKYGRIATSSQQKKVYDMLKTFCSSCELNYPCGNYSLDCAIFTNTIKIDVEYDGAYWHKDKDKDARRDEYVRSAGYRILRIKGGHKIPTIEELKDIIEKLINGNEHFIEIDVE